MLVSVSKQYAPELAHAAIMAESSPKGIAWCLLFFLDVHERASWHCALSTIFALRQLVFVILWTGASGAVAKRGRAMHCVW